MDNYVFKGLLFPVFDLPASSNILERFPQLAVWPEFSVPIRHDINKVLRYIIAVYDKNGLRLYENNGIKRKKIAAELAGWKPKPNGEFVQEVKDLIDGKDAPINQMIVRYCKLQRGPRYAVLVGMEEVFYGILAKMIAKDDIKPAEANMFEDYEKKIEIRAIEFLNGDMSKELREDLLEMIEYEKLELRPEDIALKLRMGRLAVKSTPYGEAYSPGKRKVVPLNENEL